MKVETYKVVAQLRSQGRGPYTWQQMSDHVNELELELLEAKSKLSAATCRKCEKRAPEVSSVNTFLCNDCVTAEFLQAAKQPERSIP